MAQNIDHAAGAIRLLPNLRITTHALPDVTKKPHVVGLCAIPKSQAGHNEFGWLISDFLAWKRMFHCEGSKSDQTWIANFDVSGLLASSLDKYPHGSPVAKKVASAGDNILFYQTFRTLVDKFTEALDHQAKVAEANKECLVVILSGVTNPEGFVCLDPAGNKTYVRRSHLLDVAVKYDVPITVITPAPFTTGWEMLPFFGDRVVGLGLSQATSLELFAKQCGGAFAADMVGAMLSHHGTEAPVLDQEARDLRKRLHEAVRDTLARKFSVTPTTHGFIMDGKHDEWVCALGERVGVPLSYWAKKWAAVEDTKPYPPQDTGYSFLGGAFGGIKASQLAYLWCMVRQELKSCFGDWELLTEDASFDLFSPFMSNQLPSEEKAQEVFNFVEWRSTMNFLADSIVTYFNLPTPQGVQCRYWDWDVQQKVDKEIGRFGKLRMSIFGQLIGQWPHTPMPAGQVYEPINGLQYHRPLQYVSTAVAMKFSDPTTFKPFSKGLTAPASLISGISTFLEKIRAIQLDLLGQNQEVKSLHDMWKATLLQLPKLPKPQLKLECVEAAKEEKLIDVASPPPKKLVDVASPPPKKLVDVTSPPPKKQRSPLDARAPAFVPAAMRADTTKPAEATSLQHATSFVSGLSGSACSFKHGPGTNKPFPWGLGEDTSVWLLGGVRKAEMETFEASQAFKPNF